MSAREPVRRRWIVAAILACVGLSSALTARAQPAAEPTYVLECDRLFDGETMRRTPTQVLVRGGRIVAVGPSVQVPDDAVRVPLRGATLAPGLIAETELSIPWPRRFGRPRARQSAADWRLPDISRGGQAETPPAPALEPQPLIPLQEVK